MALYEQSEIIYTTQSKEFSFKNFGLMVNIYNLASIHKCND